MTHANTILAVVAEILAARWSYEVKLHKIERALLQRCVLERALDLVCRRCGRCG